MPAAVSIEQFLWGDADPVWYWYSALCLVALINVLLLGMCYWGIRVPEDSSKAYKRYRFTMKLLAVPWVLECAWRSVFPSLYLQRFAFWDTPLNSILVDRVLACVGELAWVFQATLAVRYISCELHSEQRKQPRNHFEDFTERRSVGPPRLSAPANRVIVAVSWISWVIYVLAELASFYNTATTNELWAAIEVILDAVSYVLLAPVAAFLYAKLLRRGTARCSRAKSFCLVLTLVAVLYPCYNFFIDAPMYMKRYHEDERAHKKYLAFWDGLQDAAQRRVVTRTWDSWKADALWMSLYFSLGSWSGLLMMLAPAVTEPKRSNASLRADLVVV